MQQAAGDYALARDHLLAGAPLQEWFLQAMNGKRAGGSPR